MNPLQISGMSEAGVKGADDAQKLQHTAPPPDF